VSIEIDRSPIRPGERRTLTLLGRGSFEYSTACFVDQPPPPGFRGCRECGSNLIDVHERMDVAITAPTDWPGTQNRFRIVVTEPDGVTHYIDLQVLSDYHTHGSGGTMAAGGY